MHDFFLSHLVFGMDGARGKTGIFARELTAAHGEKAAYDIEAVARGQLQWSDLLYGYPVSRKVIQHARGVIFHSQYAADLLLDTYPDLSSVPTCIVPQACAVSFDPAERQSARAALGLRSDDLLVCAFGFLGEIKENELLLHALSSPRLSDDRRIRVAFVGALEVDPHRTRINTLIARHPLRERIEVTGYVDETKYSHYLLACDIGVSLRTKSRGETSAAMQKQLAVGCATIVSDYAAMGELPDEIVCKVPSSDAEALVRALKTLCDDSALRARLGAAARRWAAEWCHPAHVAEEYSSAIASLTTLDRARSAAGLVRRISEMVTDDPLEAEVSLPVGEAIAQGLSLHPATARWLPRGP
jgi:glycosyltransferase involved in cell wall biosynthesis